MLESGPPWQIRSQAGGRPAALVLLLLCSPGRRLRLDVRDWTATSAWSFPASWPRPCRSSTSRPRRARALEAGALAARASVLATAVGMPASSSPTGSRRLGLRPLLYAFLAASAAAALPTLRPRVCDLVARIRYGHALLLLVVLLATSLLAWRHSSSATWRRSRGAASPSRAWATRCCTCRSRTSCGTRSRRRTPSSRAPSQLPLRCRPARRDLRHGRSGHGRPHAALRPLSCPSPCSPPSVSGAGGSAPRAGRPCSRASSCSERTCFVPGLLTHSEELLVGALPAGPDLGLALHPESNGAGAGPPDGGALLPVPLPRDGAPRLAGTGGDRGGDVVEYKVFVSVFVIAGLGLTALVYLVRFRRRGPGLRGGRAPLAVAPLGARGRVGQRRAHPGRARAVAVRARGLRADGARRDRLRAGGERDSTSAIPRSAAPCSSPRSRCPSTCCSPSALAWSESAPGRAASGARKRGGPGAS